MFATLVGIPLNKYPMDQCLTFKQFLAENDPLGDLAIEMWFRHNFGASKNEARVWRNWMRGGMDEAEPWMTDKLYDHFNNEMPYAVAKGRDDVSTDEWCWNKVSEMLTKDGLL